MAAPVAAVATRAAQAQAGAGALGGGDDNGLARAAGLIVALVLVLALIVVAAISWLFGGTSGPPVANSPIPADLQQVFVNAGTALDVNPYLLASVAAQESNFGSPASHRVNGSGCAGFMQICVGGKGGNTWDESVALTEHPAATIVVHDAFNQAPNARPQGYADATPTHPDLNDPFDAVMAGAVVLRAKVGGRPIPQLDDVAHQALCGYYGACGDSAANYAQSVMTRALAWQAQHALPDTVGGGPPPGAPLPTGGGVGPAIVAAAMREQGVLYQWGGGDQNGPTYGQLEHTATDTQDLGFDCSGLVIYAVYQATRATGATGGPGSNGQRAPLVLPHSAQAQFDALAHVPTPAQLQPGDLVFFDAFNHVGIYVGNGQMIDAPETYVDPGHHVRGRVRFDSFNPGSVSGIARVTQ